MISRIGNLGWGGFRAAPRFFGCLFVLAALVACAPMQTDALLEDRASLSLPAAAMIENVPFISQDDKYCGPAAMAMAVSWTGKPLTQETAATYVYTPGRTGTLRGDMLTGARRLGRIAVPVDTMQDLLTEIASGNPVIIFQNLALAIAPKWHFAVAIGYDLDKEELILHSGPRENYRMSMTTFEHTWERGDYWALVLTAPDVLPATATREDALQAATGLERAKQASAALAAYGEVLKRWPATFGAAMGQGNLLYGSGDFRAAEMSFRRAVGIDAADPAAWNNLAYALAEQGRFEEAYEAVHEAITLSGGTDSRFLDTLEDLRQMEAG